MSNSPGLTKNSLTVEGYLNTLTDTQTKEDGEVLIAILKKMTGHTPELWHVGIIGFGSYHYKYESGREGDALPISFYPRNGKITVYLMDGTVRYADLLAKLGKHTTSRVCVYIKRLSDIDISVLEEIMRQSYEYVMSQDGHMHRAVE